MSSPIELRLTAGEYTLLLLRPQSDSVEPPPLVLRAGGTKNLGAVAVSRGSASVEGVVWVPAGVAKGGARKALPDSSLTRPPRGVTIRSVDLRTRKLAALLVIGLVVVVVLVAAGPHGMVHDDADGGCPLCFVHAPDASEPWPLGRPALLVVRLRIRSDARPSAGVAGSTCDPRAPPATA